MKFPVFVRRNAWTDAVDEDPAVKMRGVRGCRGRCSRGMVALVLGLTMGMATRLAAQEPPAKPDPALPTQVKEVSPEAPVKTLAGDATEPDPTTILKRAEMSCRALRSLRYSLRTERPGATGAQRNRSEGTVFARGWKDGQPDRFRYEVRVFPGDKDIPNEFVTGYDGENYYLIDRQTKKVTASRDRQALAAAAAYWRRFPIDEFFRPHPFEDEIVGTTSEYRGPLKVEDEECDSVYVKYASGTQEAVWYFSKKDYLPRRVDRKFLSLDGATLDHQWVVSSLTIDPKAEDEAFKLRVPEGFTRVDLAAP